MDVKGCACREEVVNVKQGRCREKFLNVKGDGYHEKVVNVKRGGCREKFLNVKGGGCREEVLNVKRGGCRENIDSNAVNFRMDSTKKNISQPLQSHFTRYSKQEKGKGLLVYENRDSNDMQSCHLVSDLNDSPMLRDSVQPRSEEQDEQEDGNESEEDDVDCENIINEEYWDIGDATCECEYFGAYFWYEERIKKKYISKRSEFNLCCNHGKIKLPNPKEPPHIMKQLLFGSGSKSDHFRDNIKIYNSMFSFTSMAGKIDASVNQSRGPRTFKLSWQNYHNIGSLLPQDGSTPKFAQLYIYDTENEVNNRINVVSRGQNINKLHIEIVDDLKKMLDSHNALAKTFRMVRDKFQEDGSSDVKLRLIGKINTDGRRYNLPSVSEVAALVVGDFEASRCDRDIIIETKSG